MKQIILTQTSLQLKEHTLLLSNPPLVSAGVDRYWIDTHFIAPKREVIVKEIARAEGYDQVASTQQHYFFFHQDKSIYDASTRQIACADILSQMPRLPNYTKFLGVDLLNDALNQELKDNIDRLGLNQLETIILETGFVGESRREANFGPSGVIIAMSDQYQLSIKL